MKPNWKPIGTHPVDTDILAVREGFHPLTGEPFIPTVVAIDENGDLWRHGEDYEGPWSDWGLTHWDYLPKNPAEVTNED